MRMGHLRLVYRFVFSSCRLYFYRGLPGFRLLLCLTSLLSLDLVPFALPGGRADCALGVCPIWPLLRHPGPPSGGRAGRSGVSTSPARLQPRPHLLVVLYRQARSAFLVDPAIE